MARTSRIGLGLASQRHHAKHVIFGPSNSVVSYSSCICCPHCQIFIYDMMSPPDTLGVVVLGGGGGGRGGGGGLPVGWGGGLRGVVGGRLLADHLIFGGTVSRPRSRWPAFYLRSLCVEGVPQQHIQ